MNKYTFLVGAHKTGTTYINKLLLANKDALQNHRILFEASNTVKLGLTQFLGKSNTKDTRANIENFLFKDKSSFDKIVFSHENISGTIPSFVKNKVMYPYLGKRLKILFDITNGMPIDIVFFIRSYDQFIMSCYSEFIRSKGYISFNKFHHDAFNEPPNWIDIIDSIQSSYPTATLNVFEHSQVIANVSPIINKIINSNSIKLDAPVKVDGRHSISGTGVRILALMSYYGFENIDNDFVNNLAKLLPKSDAYGGLNELNADEIKEYQKLYAVHRSELIAKGLLDTK